MFRRKKPAERQVCKVGRLIALNYLDLEQKNFYTKGTKGIKNTSHVSQRKHAERQGWLGCLKRDEKTC